MKHTVRDNIHTSYSLHDMDVTDFEIMGKDLLLRTQSGMTKTANPCRQVDGHVEFHNVQWDFSYAYLLDFDGDTGPFTGKKLYLRDFIRQVSPMRFCVVDETYGFNSTKYSGYLIQNEVFRECMIEIYHEGDMIFVDNTAYTGMAEVILSHDSEAVLYSVPAEVAADLEKYCWDFAANWVWHGPENGKFLRSFGEGQLGAVFGAPDFIDYLNRWAFPGCGAKRIKGLGCYDYEIPPEYRHYPQYNF